MGMSWNELRNLVSGFGTLLFCLGCASVLEARPISPSVNSALPLQPSISLTATDLQAFPQDRSDLKERNLTMNPAPAQPLDLPPEVIEQSPVLQRWLHEVPDVAAEIANRPSFRPRLRLGYSQFPSSNQVGGWNIGIEDVRVGNTALTISGDYQAAFNGERPAWGTELHYYLQPLGSYLNISPVLGYRQLETPLYTSQGVALGARLLLVLSRGGGADLSLTQSWVAPGTDREVGLTTLSVGYAVTHNLRLSTDIQQQNARQRQDSRVGLVLEWMP